MKKFLIELVLFLLLFVGVDFILGEFLRYSEAHAIGGETERNYYINNKLSEDILVFGSSRAVGHYHPDVLQQELGMTVYDCGEDETGIICFYPKLNLIKQRHVPKAIIYDIYTPDLLDGLRYRNEDYLKTLKSSYGQTEAVDSMFARYDPSANIKLCSMLYQYNSVFLNIILDNIRSTDWYNKGFYQLNTGKMTQENPFDNNHHEYVYDSEKLYFLEKFIKENKNSIRIYFAISPIYGSSNDEMYDPIKGLCKKYDIPLLNHFCDTTFTLHKELFANQNHLNLKGAMLYSSAISNDIKAQY